MPLTQEAAPPGATVADGKDAAVWDAFAIPDETVSPPAASAALDAVFHSPPRRSRATALVGDDGRVLFPTTRPRAPSPGAAPSPPSPARSPSPPPLNVNEFYERDLSRKLLRGRRKPPPGIEQRIRTTLREGFGISQPRSYQVDAVFRLAYCKPSFMYLIHKTGEGKSLVMLAMALQLRQVTVVMGPLHGLAADQVIKSKQLDKGVEAWHADEFRDDRHRKLAHRMANVRSEDVVLLFISPQALQDREAGSKYCRVLERLAVRGQISSFCVDEAHMTVDRVSEPSCWR